MVVKDKSEKVILHKHTIKVLKPSMSLNSFKPSRILSA